MKFGIDPPWYDDPVERFAFNLYAADCSSRADKINAYINDIIAGNYDIVLEFTPTDKELQYIIDRLAAAGIHATV